MKFKIFFLVIFLNTNLIGSDEIILPSNCNEPKVKYQDSIFPETNEEKLKKMDTAFLEALNNFDDCIINNGDGSGGGAGSGSGEGSSGGGGSGSPSESKKGNINNEFQSNSSSDVYGTEINKNSNEIANQKNNSSETTESGNITLKSEKGKTESQSNQVRDLEVKDDNVLKKQILELCKTFDGDDKRNCMEEYKKIN
jgi:hypothetical protein